MKIQSSNIELNANSIALALERKFEFVHIQPANKSLKPEINYIFDKIDGKNAVLNSISKVSKFEDLPKIDENLTPKEQVTKFILEYIFGVQIELKFFKELEKSRNNSTNSIDSSKFEIKRFEYNEIFESESVDFSANGSVRTADGKEINFELNLKLNREFYSSYIADRSTPKDPLVFNFTNPSAELTTNRFDFDIDFDGAADKIPFVKPGSGFLVLDYNSNNKVDDGRELVGASTGNAINELRQFDEDNNSWIDENDSIFNKLKIWEKDFKGRDLISSLKDKDIGAIYLILVKTPFQIKDSKSINGEILESGLFLTEQGLARPIQRINLNI